MSARLRCLVIVSDKRFSSDYEPGGQEFESLRARHSLAIVLACWKDALAASASFAGVRRRPSGRFRARNGDDEGCAAADSAQVRCSPRLRPLEFWLYRSTRGAKIACRLMAVTRLLPRPRPSRARQYRRACFPGYREAQILVVPAHELRASGRLQR